MKRVISLWLPWFATDHLCRLRQDWLDSPLALVGETGGRLVLQAVNAAAAEAGLRAGMSQADARAILPELRTSEADPEAEIRALTRLADWCGRFSPWTAPDEEGSGTAFAGAASIWLDVTGCTHLFGGEKAMMREITGRLAALGFTAHAAVADTPGAAWAAVRHADAAGGRRRWTILRRGQQRDALAPLPVAGLRLPPDTVAGLRAVGLRRIGDLMPIPRAALADRFGSEVADRLDQALGERPEPVSPLAPSSPWYARAAFPEPLGSAGDIADAVRGLARDLAALLEADGRGARRLSLALYHPDGTIARLDAGTSRPSRAAGHLARLFTAKLDRIEAAFGIDALTLTATASEPLSPAQASLDRHGGEDDADVAALADRLSNRLGGDSVVQLELRESHIPERAVAASPVTAGFLSAPVSSPASPPASARRTGARPAGVPARRGQPRSAPRASPWAAPRPRPLRLLSRPEEIEAIAPVPDDPPVMFRWRKQVFRIAQADGPERLAPEWWTDGFGGFDGFGNTAGPDDAAPEDGEAGAVTDGGSPMQDNIRDYYRVEDRRGRRFWVYREGVYRPGAQPHWYVHGVFG